MKDGIWDTTGKRTQVVGLRWSWILELLTSLWLVEAWTACEEWFQCHCQHKLNSVPVARKTIAKINWFHCRTKSSIRCCPCWTGMCSSYVSNHIILVMLIMKVYPSLQLKLDKDECNYQVQWLSSPPLIISKTSSFIECGFWTFIEYGFVTFWSGVVVVQFLHLCQQITYLRCQQCIPSKSCGI